MAASVKYDTTGNIRFGAGLAVSDQTDYITQNSTGAVKLPSGIGLSNQTEYITQNSTGSVKLPAGLALSNQTDYLTANSTAPLILTRTSALPTTRVLGGLAFVYNSTSARLAFHSTGTTWRYCYATSVLA